MLLGYKWHPSGIRFADDVNLIGDIFRTIERNADVLLNACKDLVWAEKSK